MNIDWVGILTVLKDFKSVRFYLLVFLALIILFVSVFKDEIVVRVKEMNVEKYELRGVRDMPGLKAFLTRVTSENGATSYAAYLYQPKDKPLVKSKVATNSEIIDNDHKLMESMIALQPSINAKFNNSDYIILDPTDPLPDTQHMHHKGLPYIMVYKLFVTEIEGEVYIIFDNKPTQEQITAIRRNLATVMNRYII